MMEASSPPLLDERKAWRIALAVAAGLTLLRLAAIFASSLELYPDEAQYWLWSRQLHWGYVSKPPMIAWLIAASTAIGGQGEAWVRLTAPLLHAGATLALFKAGARVYGAAAGLLASALYALMPAVQVSALFVATDAPLMLFLALALWAYVELPHARRPRLVAAALGAALGLAFLAKFAAVFFVIGAGLHAIVDRDARRAWGRWAWSAALGGLVLSFGPNLAWQASHGFATVAHTAEVNAHWSAASLFHPGKLLEFVLGQFGVLGPIPFAVLIGGAVVLARRRALAPGDAMLLCFAIPPLVIVSVQALLSRAHAHWAAAGYLAGVILVSGWLVRWRARGWTIAALAIQGLVAALLLLVMADPSVVDAAGQGRRLQRHRGWAETAAIVTGAARATAGRGGLSAVAVEDRYLFNELAYYGRGYFASPGAAPLRMRPPSGIALNEAELAAPLTPADGRRVLVVETVGKPPRPSLPAEFDLAEPLGSWSVKLDARHARDLDLYVAQGYRGPRFVSGRPTPP